MIFINIIWQVQSWAFHVTTVTTINTACALYVNVKNKFESSVDAHWIVAFNLTVSFDVRMNDGNKTHQFYDLRLHY